MWDGSHVPYMCCLVCALIFHPNSSACPLLSCSTFFLKAIFISARLNLTSSINLLPPRIAPRPENTSKCVRRIVLLVTRLKVKILSPLRKPGTDELPFHLSSLFSSTLVITGLYVLSKLLEEMILFQSRF